VRLYNWDAPFLVAGGLCLLGAFLFLRIDPNKRIHHKDYQKEVSQASEDGILKTK
jgi:hypothetical protein